LDPRYILNIELTGFDELVVEVEKRKQDDKPKAGGSGL
jgi:hypothetical protein